MRLYFLCARTHRGLTPMSKRILSIVLALTVAITAAHALDPQEFESTSPVANALLPIEWVGLVLFIVTAWCTCYVGMVASRKDGHTYRQYKVSFIYLFFSLCMYMCVSSLTHFRVCVCVCVLYIENVRDSTMGVAAGMAGHIFSIRRRCLLCMAPIRSICRHLLHHGNDPVVCRYLFVDGLGVAVLRWMDSIGRLHGFDWVDRRGRRRHHVLLCQLHRGRVGVTVIRLDDLCHRPQFRCRRSNGKP